MGFLTSLQRNHEFAGRIADDAEALQLAVEQGVTGTEGKRNMGIGLSLLRTFADQLGGDLWIASGGALLHRRTVSGTQRASTISSITPWQGAWVCLDAPVA
ncbi:MAG: hypothetical protein HY292_15780 [Planctomycetes bacterium]|nr:hypothetical protein [Planctomycetota bacterium]